MELYSCEKVGCKDLRWKTSTELNIHRQLKHSDEAKVCKLCPEVGFTSWLSLCEHYEGFHKFICGIMPKKKTSLRESNSMSVKEKLFALGVTGSQENWIERSFITNFDKANCRPLWTFEYLHPKAAFDIKGYGTLHRYYKDSKAGNRHLDYNLLTDLGLFAGHLACARNHWFDIDAFTETYFLTNITPLPGQVNCGVWSGLEQLSRKLLHYWDHVSVFSGVIYDNSVKPIKKGKENPIWIGKYLYKILVLESDERPTQIHVYCIPNNITTEIPKENFKSSLEDIEALTGIRFLSSSYFPPSTYRCNSCHKTVTSLESIERHKKIHATQKCCKRCGNLFPTTEDVESHKQLCYLKCSLCTRVFPSERCLKVHFKFSHTTNQPSCDVCGETFPDRITLKNHRRIHTGVCKFKCKYCEKSYLKHGTISDHLSRRHKNEIPCYVCLETGNEITIKKRKQVKQADKQFKCKKCNFISTHKYKLKNHEAVHIKERNFKCKYCNTPLKRMITVYQHCQDKHEDKPRCCINLLTGEETIQIPDPRLWKAEKKTPRLRMISTNKTQAKPKKIRVKTISSDSDSSADEFPITPEYQPYKRSIIPAASTLEKNNTNSEEQQDKCPIPLVDIASDSDCSVDEFPVTPELQPFKQKIWDLYPKHNPTFKKSLEFD